MCRPALLLALLLALTGVARAAEKSELTIDMPAEAATLDPHLQWDTDSYSVYRNIFDELLTRDASGAIVGQVASAWHYADPLTLVFDLRPGIRFSDGTPLTAADVAFSVNRIIDPAFHSPAFSQYDQITRADVTGPAQVTLHTRSPYPVLLAQLVKLSIVPEGYVRRVGDTAFNAHPIGSGPYRLAEWRRGVSVTLEAVPDDWHGPAPFPRVVFRTVPDPATRVADLRAGRADLVRALSPDDAVALKGEAGVQVLSTPTERVVYLFVNAGAGPTRDVRVRRAIAMAIDRDTLIGALQQGYARPVAEVSTPANFGYDPDVKPWPYDPDAARRLLHEAGAEGAHVSFLTSPVYDRRLNEAVQQMLGEVGLVVDIQSMDQAAFLHRREGGAEGAGGLSQGRWSCACQDVDGVIFPLFRTGSPWSTYSNPAFDAAVDAGRTTLDPQARLAAYRRAFAVLREDVPGIGLFGDVALYGASAHLRWTPSVGEAMFVGEMRWAP